MKKIQVIILAISFCFGVIFSAYAGGEKYEIGQIVVNAVQIEVSYGPPDVIVEYGKDSSSGKIYSLLPDPGFDLTLPYDIKAECSVVGRFSGAINFKVLNEELYVNSGFIDREKVVKFFSECVIVAHELIPVKEKADEDRGENEVTEINQPPSEKIEE